MTAEQKICNAFLDMLETTPFTEIKANDLAKRATVARSSFYFYFDSVFSVLDHLENEFIRGISDEYATIYKLGVKKSGRISTQDTIRPTIEYVGQHLREFRILSGPNGSRSFQDKLLQRAENVGIVLYCDGSIPTYEVMLRLNIMAGAQWYLYRWWANHEDQVSTEDILRFVSDFMDKLSF